MNNESELKTEDQSSTTVQDNSVSQPCIKSNVIGSALEDLLFSLGITLPKESMGSGEDSMEPGIIKFKFDFRDERRTIHSLLFTTRQDLDSLFLDEISLIKRQDIVHNMKCSDNPYIISYTEECMDNFDVYSSGEYDEAQKGWDSYLKWNKIKYGVGFNSVEISEMKDDFNRFLSAKIVDNDVCEVKFHKYEVFYLRGTKGVYLVLRNLFRGLDWDDTTIPGYWNNGMYPFSLANGVNIDDANRIFSQHFKR